MSTKFEREGYRQRLTKGDIVYFVEGENSIGAGDLAVKKATVDSTTGPGGWKRHYPSVSIWDNPSEEPKGAWVSIARSPRELFTAEEVARVLRDQEGPLASDTRPVDELLVDPIAGKELAGALGGAAITRLAQDELRRPGDPEY